MKRKGILLASLCLSAMAMTFLVGTKTQIKSAEAIVVSEFDPEAKEGRPAYTPADQYYSSHQGISMNHVGDIKSVWDYYKGDGIRVAVIDSGFDLDNPDFIDEQSNSMFSVSEGRMFAHATAVTGQSATYTMDKTGETGTNSVVQFAPQEENLGYKINDVWFKGDSILRPWSGYSKYSKHGTDVCSTLASRAHDTSHTGVIGIAPKVTIVPIKVDFWTDSIASALYYIKNTLNSKTSSFIDVINMSIEAPYYKTMSDYISDIVNQGTIVVAAAGNSNSSDASYPASSPKTIGVGALARDTSDTKASFSNYNASNSTRTGNNNVDLMAPGYVYTASWNSSADDHTYGETYGTSFSSPIVAGAAALWKEAHPSGTVDEFKTDLFNSCVDIGSSGWDTTFGYGRLDIEELIGHVAVTGINITESSVSLNLDNHETATLHAQVSPNNATNQNVGWISSNDNIATVDDYGVVTPVAIGECSITAFSYEGDFEDTCSVEVTGTTTSSYTIGWGTASGTSGTYSNFSGTSGSVNNLLDFSTSQNSSQNAPAVSSSELRLYYAGSGNGGSITITPKNSAVITGFVMTVESNYNPTVKYFVNGGSATTISSSGTSYKVSGLSASTSLVIQNANTSNKQLRIYTITFTYTQTPYITSIAIENAPTKTSYTVGECFDPSGLVLRRNYSNNSHNTYAYSGHESSFTFSPSLESPLTISNTSITITYSGFSTTQSITVQKGAVTSITASVSKTYYVGQSIVKADITVVDSNDDPVTDFTFSSYQFTYNDADSGGALTDKELTVSYLTFTDDFIVKVQRKAYESTVGDEDTLNREKTGVASGSTSYSNWSNKTDTSTAIYAGNSAGDHNSIQLRSSGNSGIITTTSGGSIKKITVVWEGNTVNDRTLDIYGKNTAYSATSELYNSSTQGTLLGSIIKGTSTALEVSGDYAYVGVRSRSNAMYLTSIKFSYGGTETPTNVANYIMFTDTEGQCEDVGLTKGKFTIACEYFANLSKADRNIFMTSDEYVISTARTRFIDWAKHHHKTIIDSDDGYIITPSIQNGLIVNIENNQISIIVIVASVVGLSALSGYIFIRKRKEN